VPIVTPSATAKKTAASRPRNGFPTYWKL